MKAEERHNSALDLTRVVAIANLQGESVPLVEKKVATGATWFTPTLHFHWCRNHI